MNTVTVLLPYTKVNLSLTAEAMDFLSETTNGTSHFAILEQLIKDTSVTPSSTSKRGNVIPLDVGQVECSIHSCCARFGIGRKKFEAIMRQMEQHGIIRMHRSRLATVAYMTCITSWLLSDGSTMTNGTDGSLLDHPTDELTDSHDVTSHDSSHINDGNADATSDLGSQSPENTDHALAPEATAGVFKTATPVVSDHSDTLKATGQNAHELRQLSLVDMWKEQLEKPLSQNATVLQNE